MAERHQFRADWHDYNGGIYFVTICTAGKKHYLGKIISHEMRLSEIGSITKATIEEFTKHFTNDELWNYVIMPNHIHIVIAVGTRHGASPETTPHTASPLTSTNLGCLKPKRHDAPASQDYHHNNRLGVIIGQIKSTIKREANRRALTFAWQQRYHEHIIRNQRALDNIMKYIDSNVENWGYDRFNPESKDNAAAPWRNQPTNAETTRHAASPETNTETNADAPWCNQPTNTVGTRHGASPETNTISGTESNADAPWRVPTNNHENYPTTINNNQQP